MAHAARRPRVRGHTVAVLTGQDASAERREGQHPDTQRFTGRKHLTLDASVQQGIPHLIGHNG